MLFGCRRLTAAQLGTHRASLPLVKCREQGSSTSAPSQVRRIEGRAPWGTSLCPAWARGGAPQHFTLHLECSAGKSKAWEDLPQSSATAPAQHVPSRKGCNSLQRLHHANALIARKGRRRNAFLLLGLTQEHVVLRFPGLLIHQCS